AFSHFIGRACRDSHQGEARVTGSLPSTIMGYERGGPFERDSPILQWKGGVGKRSRHLPGMTAMNHPEVNIDQIRRAKDRIAGTVRRTPLERSGWLSVEHRRDVFLKLECFQLTGSFKLRGALAKLSTLTQEKRKRGVLTVSAGNHGLAVAHCCELMGVKATIVVPESASRAKVEAIRRYPVTLIERGARYDDAERAAREMERETGATFVSPYNDPEVIAGQGTIGLEILEDRPDLGAIVVPVGGGGLLAGVAIAAKSINPKIKVYGAEPLTSPTMTAALQAGRIVEIEEQDTLADGSGGKHEHA